jgi:23S rRNA (uracil1939-C5)-methyltransferase
VTIPLRVEEMAHGGDGLGRHDGLAVFVPGAMPGDLVRVEITEERPRFARGRVIELLDPSPDRIEPPCPHLADGCGGCPWQAAGHPAQLRWKQRTVRSQLAHLGDIHDAEVRPIDPASPAFGYRNRMDLRVSGGRPALAAARSHDLVELDLCLLPVEPLQRVIRRLDGLAGLRRLTLRAGVASGETVAIVDGDPPADASDRWGIPVRAPAAARIHEEVAGVRFRIGGRAFFQVSTPGAGRLVHHVDLALAGAEGVLLDGYAGVGLFAATVGRRFGAVTAVESDRRAVDDLGHNTDGRVTVVGRRLEEAVAGLGRFEAAVVDPPRAGLGPGVPECLAAAGVRWLAMVSCDPATFARDARRLVTAGFVLEWVQPLDLFPQTYHVEIVARFTRAGAVGA